MTCLADGSRVSEAGVFIYSAHRGVYLAWWMVPLLVEQANLYTVSAVMCDLFGGRAPLIVEQANFFTVSAVSETCLAHVAALRSSTKPKILNLELVDDWDSMWAILYHS